MPRDAIPFSTEDVSALAKSLRGQLAGRAEPPGHVEMLNMLARAAGWRNFQHLRAQAGAVGRLERAEEAPAAADHRLVLRASRYFDGAGRLASWPARTALQNLCLWALWARVPAGRGFDEREISGLLAGLNLFGDHAILRRTMCSMGLMTRDAAGRAYRRVERSPPPEAAALIRHLGRAGQGASGASRAGAGSSAGGRSGSGGSSSNTGESGGS